MIDGIAYPVYFAIHKKYIQVIFTKSHYSMKILLDHFFHNFFDFVKVEFCLIDKKLCSKKWNVLKLLLI